MGALTEALTNFLAIFSLGYTNLAPATINLALTLLSIEFVLFGIYFAFGARNFVDVFFKILFIGFWWWLINAFPTLMTMVLNSFISWGAIAGGSSAGVIAPLMLDPSAIAGYGMTAIEPITRAMDNFGWREVGQSIFYGFIALIILILFFVIAIQVFITVLEFYLVVALTSVLLPFAFIKRTAFLAEKAIGAVVSFGIKLMVLAFIITVAQPVLAGLVIAGPVTYQTMFALLLTAGALAVLVLHAPGVAAGIMAGSPSLTMASVATTGLAAGAAGTGAGAAAFGATKAATNLGGSGIRGAARLTGGAAAGAAVGKIAGNVAGGGPVSRAAYTTAGAARGAGSVLAQSAREGTSNFTSSVKSSFGSGARAAVGQSRAASTTAGSSNTHAPSWAAASLSSLSTATRMASHASGPTGGGSNFRL